MRDTHCMEEARKVASDVELREIAAAGEGFVADPFNRWWHAATCPRLLGMTVGQPKWFAPTRAALDAYLQQRTAEYATAKPILACKTCGDAETPVRAAFDSSVRSTRGVVDDGASARVPCVRRAETSFEIWADECVRNDSKAGSSAGDLRALVRKELRALPEPDGRVLRASYAGRRFRKTDVENLLFNNIEQTLALFSPLGRAGIRFEDRGLEVPAAPDSTSWQSYYNYGLTEVDEPFVTVDFGRLVCRVPEVIVPDGPARLAARTWLAVRSARPDECSAAPLDSGDYLLRIEARGLDVGTTIKALVDGASAAMQRDEPHLIGAAVLRVARLLDADPDELLRLATDEGAPLGTRSRSNPTAKEFLFTLDDPGQVRVTPDDDRCVGAEVVVRGDDEPARITVEVYSATRR